MICLGTKFHWHLSIGLIMSHFLKLWKNFIMIFWTFFLRIIFSENWKFRSNAHGVCWWMEMVKSLKLMSWCTNLRSLLENYMQKYRFLLYFPENARKMHINSVFNFRSCELNFWFCFWKTNLEENLEESRWFTEFFACNFLVKNLKFH